MYFSQDSRQSALILVGALVACASSSHAFPVEPQPSSFLPPSAPVAPPQQHSPQVPIAPPAQPEQYTHYPFAPAAVPTSDDSSSILPAALAFGAAGLLAGAFVGRALGRGGHQTASSVAAQGLEGATEATMRVPLAAFQYESQATESAFSSSQKAAAAAFAGAPALRKPSSVTRHALDQSSRYADLGLSEEQLIKNGQHVLVAYIMKPKAGYDYLATAAHFAAESSTGTNVNVCTTDDFTKSVDALVYYIDPENEEMKIAYPVLLFDRNITDGRAMMCSILTLTIGNNQGMGDVEYGKIYDMYFPPQYLRLFDGPATCIKDMWRILGRGLTDGGLVVGTIIKPKLGLQPKPFGEACYAFWMGGDFIKNDEPQGNQVFCQMSECIPEVVKAMRQTIKETGEGKLFSANITADDPNEMIARGKYVLGQFGPLAENCAFLVDGYVAGGTAVTAARRNFPKQFLHYHRAGHGAVTSPQTQRGYTAFVHTKISRIIGASGIHVGTMSFGKMEGDASDKGIAYMLQDDVADGPYYTQEWEGMKQTTPIISGGMNSLRLPAFFENLGHSNVILTAGGGAFGHKDGPKQGAISCGQGEEAWKLWKAGQYGDVSLSDGVIEYAKTHEELKGAFLTFQKDSDQIYPGWKEKLGYTGESSVQAASFDWQKKASAAAAFAGEATGSSSRGAKTERHASYEAPASFYEHSKKTYCELEYNNDVGYFPDGTPMNKAGNENNHPENMSPDPHTPGAPLPVAHYTNSVGYMPDGTPMNKAGNDHNHPEIQQPDTHVPGSPIPPPLFGYVNDVGYMPDGTPMDLAGNEMNHFTGTLPNGTKMVDGAAAAAFTGERASTTTSRIQMPARGGGEYDVSDADIEKFYEETVSGSGGMPPRKGLIEECVVKFFLGEFFSKPDGTMDFQRASKYTGPAGMVGPKDAKAAVESLVEQMKVGKYVCKAGGGPGADDSQKVMDDGKGWVWLAADMTPGGLGLALYKSVPYGKRPLLVAKQNDVDAMVSKINWQKVLDRVEITMGGPQIKQR